MTIRGPEEATAPLAQNDLDPLLDLEAGRAMVQTGRGEEPVQVAGLTRWLRDMFPRKARPGKETRARAEEKAAEEAKARTEGLLQDEERGTLLERVQEQAPEAPERPEGEPATQEEGERFLYDVATLRPQAEALPARPSQGGEGRNINLDYVTNRGDWGPVLEAIQTDMPSRGVRTHAQVRADVDADARKYLEPLLKGAREPRPFTDREALAARQLTMTLTEDLVERQARLADPNVIVDDEEQVEYLRQLSAYKSWVAYVQGSITETARAMNSFRMMSGVLKNPSVAGLSKALQESGNERTARQTAEIAQRYIEAADGDAVEGLTRLAKTRTFGDTLATLWQASILSGLGTHAVNITSNALVQGVESLLVRPAAGLVGTARRAVTGADDGVYTGEAAAEAIGAIQSFNDATKLAGAAFIEGWKRGGDWREMPDIGTIGGTKVPEAEVSMNTTSLGSYVPGGPAMNPLRSGLDFYEKLVKATSFGALQAEDQFFKELTYGKTLTGLAYRQAASEGKTGAERTRRMNELLADPPTEMHEQALAEADRQTFTNRPDDGVIGSTATAMSGIVQRHPGLKLVMPFIRTPANLLNYTLMHGPGTQLLMDSWRKEIRAGGARADVAKARLGLGVTAGISTWWMYDAGVITGAGPQNQAQREALERTGWKPHSIRINGTYYPYDRLDPFGMQIATVADLRDAIAYSADETNAAQWGAMYFMALAHYAVDATYLQGISNVMKAIEGGASPSTGHRLVGRTAAGFIPGLVKSGADALDGDPRRSRYDPNNWQRIYENEIRRRLPHFQTGMPPARHWDGVVKAAHNNVIVRTVSPVKPSYNRPVDWIDRRGNPESRDTDEASVQLVENQVNAGEPHTKLTVRGLTLPLLELDNGRGFVYDKYFEIVGGLRRQMVEEVIASRSYERAESGPNSTRSDMLRSALARARTAAEKPFLEWFDETFEAGEMELSETAVLLYERRHAAREIRRGDRPPPDTIGSKVKGVPARETFPRPPHMPDAPDRLRF